MTKKICITVMLLLLILSKHSIAQELEGTWQGRLNFFSKDIRVVFHFKKDSAGEYTSSMDSPEQGSFGNKVNDVEKIGDSLQFEIPEMDVEYSGTYNKDSAAFYGHMKQHGFKIALKLIKGEGEDLLYKRPQKPLKPYPYVEEEVTVINKKAGDTLAGTFTRPFGKGKFPAVILITGSGAEDRDETVFAHKPFLILADYLTRRGFAVLRCDDRGTAKSTGNFSSATVPDFASDAGAQLDYLKSRPDVNSKRIGLLGHSEGGTVAPMLAAKRNDVAFIILMAGVTVDFFDNLIVQDSLFAVTEGESKEKVAKFLENQKKLFEIISTSKDSSSAAEGINNYLSGTGASDKEIIKAIRQLCSPWLRWYVGFNPQENLRKLHCPVLAVNGEKDIQVPAEINIAAVDRILKESANKNYKTEIFPDLNHLFQQCKKCSLSEYVTIEETMNPIALTTIGDWMEKNFLQKK
jgi:dipeptidyl aminopeptidase/acylaminoacyl peptidase